MTWRYIIMGIVAELAVDNVVAMKPNECIGEQLRRFADYCAGQEQCCVLSMEPFVPVGEGLRKGCQNAGLWQVKTLNKESQPQNFIIKSGNFDEFESSRLLHSKLSDGIRDRIPSYIEFAYPKYMQQIEVCESGISQVGKPYSLGQDIGTGIPRSQDSSKIHTLLFMDEATGIPGNQLVLTLGKYSEIQQRVVYKNLAQAANALLFLGHPDDSQNLDNIMIDPLSGTVTYIDFDRFHFGEIVGRSWYYTLVDNHHGIFESARRLFCDELDETLQPFANERLLPEEVVRTPRWLEVLRAPDLEDIPPFACMSAVMGMWEQWANGWYKNSMLSDGYSRKGLLENFLSYPFAVIKDFYADKDKESLLRKIKETAEEQTRLRLESELDGMVVVSCNELYITEQEMWAIEVSSLPAEAKTLLERAYVCTVGKPWLYLMWDPDQKASMLSREEQDEFRDQLPMSVDELTAAARAYRFFSQKYFVEYTDAQEWNAKIRLH
jgi:hypothetical protein